MIRGVSQCQKLLFEPVVVQVHRVLYIQLILRPRHLGRARRLPRRMMLLLMRLVRHRRLRPQVVMLVSLLSPTDHRQLRLQVGRRALL